ncbi:N-acetylneuraminate synthase family protein [Zavarzinia compransoris]|uniref:N-acetylneuraminate synthase family protein n=1 Tax=Zavarzinia marina TaxID=2911065 RepID=UPI001F437498|nr:N-acetylneuraminate synthase family protein [Zavarzinia marina]MCF4164174.1 N-acetylneuraminate synthase family protein [Zavarzinia marina]
MNGFHIAGRPVGGDAPCFIIAEAGVNHNGDIAMARRLIDAAAECGADAVKFQTWRTDALTRPDARKAAYQQDTTGANGTQADLLRSLELTFDDFAGLARYAEARGILFLSTPFDPRSLSFLVGLGLPVIKIPSGEVRNHLHLAAVGRTGLPVILSTGMARLADVDTALDHLARAGGGPVAVLQCTSNYPADPADANLRAIPVMAKALGVVTGYSDHTLGNECALAARALGAAIIEKHITLDHELPGPDHRASALPDEFAALVAGVRAVEKALGDGVKRPRASEGDVAAVAQRSLCAAHGLHAGDPISLEDLVALRPGDGIPADRLDLVVGRRLTRDIAAGRPLGLEDFA